jgi:replicative DNA helicase
MQESRLNDSELERTILSVMLGGKAETAYFADRLHKTDMYFNHHQTVFSGLVDLFKYSHEVDYMTLRSKFTGDTRILELLEQINGLVPPQSLNKEQAHKLLKEFSSKRAILKLCKSALESIENNTDSEEVIQVLQRESTDILRSSGFLLNQSGVAQSEDWVREIQEEIDSGEREEDEYDGAPTGMRLLDDKMKGLQDINVISAPTGHGKSMLALNWMVNISYQPKFYGKILYLNYEMNQKQLARRVLAIASGVTYNEIYNRRFHSIENVDQYNRAREHFLERKNIILTNNDPKTLSVTMALIQEHVTCNDVRIVVIDHLGEIASEREEHNMDHWMKLSKYVKELKNVTTRLGVSLVVVAQQNREGYNNGQGQAGGLGRVAGTLELSRVCDCFINLYSVGDDRIMSLEKNRNGEACKFIVDFDGPTQTIKVKEEIK